MRTCGCGRIVRWFDAWSCQVCGAPCCSECAYTPEGTEFCAGCLARAEAVRCPRAFESSRSPEAVR
jgi:hypothetical protein